MKKVILPLIIMIVLVLALAPPLAAESVGGPMALMTQQERENTEIALVLEETGATTEQARELADRVEQLWNGGNYEQALLLFDQLVALVGLQKIDICGNLRVPIVTSSPVDRSSDVLIGNYDSVYCIDFEVHRPTGNLLVPVLYEGDGYPSKLMMFHSTDNGETWTLGAWVGTSGWYESISATVRIDYCYVAINKTSSSRQPLLRFDVFDGHRVEFPSGPQVTVSYESLSEMVLTSTDEWDLLPDMYLVGIGGALGTELIMYQATDHVDFENWTEEATGITDGGWGLDAVGTFRTFIPPYSEYYLFVSYITVTFDIKVVGWYGTGWDTLFFEWAGVDANETSISAYLPQQLVACAFEGDHWDGQNTTLSSYIVWLDNTIPGGNPNWNWFHYIQEFSNEMVFSPEIELRGGGGVDVCYMFFHPGIPAYLNEYHKSCSYDQIRADSLRDLPAHRFADKTVHSEVRYDIEFMDSTNSSGVVYVSLDDEHLPYFTGAGCCIGIRGNADGDGYDAVNVGDLSYLVSYLFDQPPGPAPPCFEEGDVDASSSINVGDLSHLVSYLFDQPPGPAPLPCP